MKKLTCLAVPMLSCLLLPVPASAEINGNLSRDNFRSSVCNIASMRVELKLDEAFGEPLVTSKMRWQAGPNTNADCLSKLTNVWIKTRIENDAVRFIKVSPEIMQAAQDFGQTATESPSWAKLFCMAPQDTASCEPPERARQLVSTNLNFESFEVVTEARAIANIDTGSKSGRETTSTSMDISFESLLTDAIDNAIAPGSSNTAEPASTTPVPQQNAETPEAAQKRLTLQRDQHAEKAMSNVVSLIASSLAQYTTPAHECESARVVGNWVQARGTCQLNFRSESNHDYLCSENGRSRPIRSTQKANVNLSADISHISDIRVSKEGWAAVVLEFKDQVKEVTEGNYKTNRWQFTTSSDKLDDLQHLAQSLATLKNYCETNPG